jgi:hypothetical protein
MIEYEICRKLYDIAVNTEPTGDKTQWPDALAFKHPIMDLRVLLRYLQLRDHDLVAVVLGVARDAKRDEVTLVMNVLSSATHEQKRRRRAAGDDGPAPVIELPAAPVDADIP